MNDQSLNEFQNNPFMREAVYEFLISQMNKLALERVYEKKDTTGIADAKEIIENAFIELQQLYSKNKEVKPQSIR